MTGTLSTQAVNSENAGEHEKCKVSAGLEPVMEPVGILMKINEGTE